MPRKGRQVQATRKWQCLKLFEAIGVVAFLWWHLGLLAAPAAAQEWTWSTETVDTSGRFTSMAIDKQDNVHMSYSDGNSRILKYAFRSSATSRWFTMALDSGLSEFSTHITLDAADNPHICYTPQVFKYARFDGQRWITQEVAPGGLKEYTCSIVVAPDGTTYTSWYQLSAPDNSSYLHIKAAVLKNGVWLARTVDLEREAGKWNSMVMDSNGNPAVSYSVWVAGQLKLGRWNGKDWDTEILDAASRDAENVTRGMGNSIRRDAQGNLHISYYQRDALKYAHQVEGRWQIEKIDPITWFGSWIGFWSSLDFDRQGKPHISYDDGGTLKHAYLDGKSWHIQVIAVNGLEPYRYSSLGIASDNTIYISYRDPQDGSLKVAIGRPGTVASSNSGPATANK